MYLFSYSPRPKIRGNSDTELLGGLSSLGLAGPGDPKPKGDVEFCIFEPFNCLICYRYSVFLSLYMFIHQSIQDHLLLILPLQSQSISAIRPTSLIHKQIATSCPFR